MSTDLSAPPPPARLDVPAELVSFIEGLPEPHILFDRQYRIVAANAAYRAAFAPRGTVIGRTCYEVSHHFSVPCYQAGESCPLALSRRSGQRERVLHLHHTPQGEAYIDIELTPLADAADTPLLARQRLAQHRLDAPLGVRALGDHDDVEVPPAPLPLHDRLANLVEVVRDLGDQDHVHRAREPGVQRDEPRVAPHHLHHDHAIVRLGGRVQLVDRLHRRRHGGVESERRDRAAHGP